MPSEYHINREDELVSIRVSGATGLDDVQRLGEQMLEDSEYHAFWPHLVDLRGMQLTFSDEAVDDIVEFLDARFRPNVVAPIAVVIDGDLDAETCADIFHLTCTVDSTELFDDYPLAIRWLIRHNFNAASANQKYPPGDDAHQRPEQIGP